MADSPSRLRTLEEAKEDILYQLEELKERVIEIFDNEVVIAETAPSKCSHDPVVSYAFVEALANGQYKYRCLECGSIYIGNRLR